MVTVRTVKLRNSWFYNKSSNALQIGSYSKEFLIEQLGVDNFISYKRVSDTNTGENCFICEADFCKCKSSRYKKVIKDLTQVHGTITSCK